MRSGKSRRGLANDPTRPSLPLARRKDAGAGGSDQDRKRNLALQSPHAGATLKPVRPRNGSATATGRSAKTRQGRRGSMREKGATMPEVCSGRMKALYPAAQTEMGAGIAASPHLRRAKDLPVFVSFDDPKVVCSSILAHQLRRRFQKSIPIRRRVRLPSAALLGPIPCRVACFPKEAAFALERLALPALLPAGPIRSRSFSSSPAGGDRAFRPFLPFLSLPTLRGGWDFRPDHPFVMRLAASRSKRKNRSSACG